MKREALTALTWYALQVSVMRGQAERASTL